MNYDRVVGGVSIHLTDDIIKEKLARAQDALDIRIKEDTNEYVPRDQNGDLRRSAEIPEPGIITWGGIGYAVPYAHYQYVGLLRTDENGRVVVAENEHKPVLTDRKLEHHYPGTYANWFEMAKQAHLNEWIRVAKREVK